MPWNESTKMDEKPRFVPRFLDCEKISRLCEEFGISRVIGHKIIDRYKESGFEGFNDRSRKPFRQANRLPFQVEQLIINVKKEFPNWVHRRFENGYIHTIQKLVYRPKVRSM